MYNFDQFWSHDIKEKIQNAVLCWNFTSCFSPSASGSNAVFFFFFFFLVRSKVGSSSVILMATPYTLKRGFYHKSTFFKPLQASVEAAWCPKIFTPSTCTHSLCYFHSTRNLLAIPKTSLRTVFCFNSFSPTSIWIASAHSRLGLVWWVKTSISWNCRPWGWNLPNTSTHDYNSHTERYMLIKVWKIHISVNVISMVFSTLAGCRFCRVYFQMWTRHLSSKSRRRLCSHFLPGKPSELPAKYLLKRPNIQSKAGEKTKQLLNLSFRAPLKPEPAESWVRRQYWATMRANIRTNFSQAQNLAKRQVNKRSTDDIVNYGRILSSVQNRTPV